jgi:hypothetical protein
MARFGAMRLLTPVEPFYYAQVVEFVARAKAVLSPVTGVQLPISQAMPPIAEACHPPCKPDDVSWG